MKRLIRALLIGASIPAAADAARAELVHQWKFNGYATDSIGSAHGTLGGGAAIVGDRLSLDGISGQMLTAPIDSTITERTLVSWVSLNDLNQPGGGSALSIQIGGGGGAGGFDGIIYGERVPGQWMNGSNGWSRSVVDNGGALETVSEPGEVMMAITYAADNSITIYRDGALYAAAANASHGTINTYTGGAADVIFGRRHDGAGNPLNGFINEARIYNSVLSPTEIGDIFLAGPDFSPSDPPPLPPAPELIHQWTFNGSSADLVGNAHGILQNGAAIAGDRLAINGGQMLSLPIDETVKAKTLVSWVSLNDLDLGRGGSALSLGHTGAKFDGIVYAEILERTWMAGSNGFARTQNPQTYGTPETVSEPGEVMMAIVYGDDGNISLYRDGQLYGSYQSSGPETFQGAIDRALIGPRHVGTATLDGFVNEARIYSGALSATEVLDLFNAGPSFDPAPPIPPAPPAMLLHQWTFEDGTANDSVGAAHGTLHGGAQIVGGRLSLDGVDDYMRSAPIDQNIYEKTLVAWVSLDNLTQQSGSALTIENPTANDVFDGIVYGERVAGQWMNGSNNFSRSVPNNGGAGETVVEPGEVMVAIVYALDNSIQIYRDGELYATASQGELQVYPADVADVLIGLRHLDIAGGVGTVGGNDQFLAGFVNEARIYRGALTPETIRSIYEAGAVPEPSTYVLLACGATGLICSYRRRRR